MPLTPEIICVLLLLGLTVGLLVLDVARVDVIALIVLVSLGLTPWLPGVAPLISTEQLFSGFASNAVLAVIGVMIIGAGLDKTGLMYKIAGLILRVGGKSERGIISLVAGSVGLISGFMQNVGAAALFIPVVSRIAKRINRPMSGLLMPMGFAAILGGTLTMVGSGPLILLNDLLPKSMPAFGLFEVFPIGLSLLVSGILLFVLLGRWLLPQQTNMEPEVDSLSYFKQLYGIQGDVRIVRLAKESSLAGQTINDVEAACHVHIILMRGKDLVISPHRDLNIDEHAGLGIMAEPESMKAFLQREDILPDDDNQAIKRALAAEESGIAEIIIPPNSNLVNKSIREVRIRRMYGIAPLAIYRAGRAIKQSLRERRLQAGDSLLCHISWEDLARLEQNKNFTLVTTDYPKQSHRPHKLTTGLLCFALTLGLILFSELPLSLALLIGALGMILGGVLDMDEAYQAVSWSTVFLLAGLIPLGIVVEQSGTASWIAQSLLLLLGEQVSPWQVQILIALLATAFSLVMSNVGATVLLVPLALEMANATGTDPRAMALLVGLAVSNAFIIPTHQVNALIMGPGGYQVRDFLLVGSLMSALFIAVLLIAINGLL